MKVFLELPRFYKKLIAVSVDLLFLPIAFCMAVMLRYEGISDSLFQQYAWLILGAPLIAIPIFIRLGLYRAVIRFIDHKLVYVVVVGVTLAVALMAALAAMATHFVGMSRAVFAIYWVVAIYTW